MWICLLLRVLSFIVAKDLLAFEFFILTLALKYMVIFFVMTMSISLPLPMCMCICQRSGVLEN